MTIDYRHGLSILELVVYLPALVMAIVMGSRHGFGRSDGWYFFIIFALARIIGNGCYLGTINDPLNTNLYIAYSILNSIGLSPLLLGLIAALTRLNSSIERKTGEGHPPTVFRLVGIVSIVGMVLSIIGMASTKDIQDAFNKPITKVGIVLYVISWVGFMILTFMIWNLYDGIERGEHRLLYAVSVCAPILAVRLVYSVLNVFDRNSIFNMFTGNTTVFLVMDVLEEIAIVYIIMVTGMTLQLRGDDYDPDKEINRPVAAADNTDYQMMEQGGRSGYGQQQQQQQELPPQRERLPKRPLRGGPIRMLIIFLMNTIEGRE